MISPADIQETKYNFTLISIILIVYNLVSYKLRNTVLFNEKWMNFTIATLIGVSLHGLLTNKISLLINNYLNIHRDNVKNTIYDLIKFSTIFVSQKIINSFLIGEDIIFDVNWMMIFVMTIIGYSIFNMYESLVPRVGSHQPLLNDLVKISMGTLLAGYSVDGVIDSEQLFHLSSLLSGYTISHLFTKYIVLNV